MGEYKIKGYADFIDSLDYIYGNDKIRKRFKDFLRSQGFEITDTLYIGAFESNTAISKKAIESNKYNQYIIGYCNGKDSFDYYELDRELLKDRIGTKERLNINTGNLIDLMKKGGIKYVSRK